MESQDKMQPESGRRASDQKLREGDLSRPLIKLSEQTGEIRTVYETPEGDNVPVEPTEREIEEGANEAYAYMSEYTGHKPIEGPMDEEAKRVFYRIHEKREGWTESMEADARCALQFMYPDVGGAAANGPL